MGKSRYIFKLNFNPVKIESIIHRWLKLQGFKYIEKGKYRFFRAGDSKKNFTYLEYYFYKDELIIFAYVGSYKRPFPLENGMLYSNITVPYRMLLEDLFYCINNPLDTDKIFNKRKVVVSVRNDVSDKEEENKKEIKESKKEKIKKEQKNNEEEVEDIEEVNEDVVDTEDSNDEVIEENKEKKSKKTFKRNKKEITKASMKRRSVASIICFSLGIINFIMSLFGVIMNFLILVIIYILGIYGLKSKKSKFSIIGLVLLAISLLIMIIRYKL